MLCEHALFLLQITLRFFVSFLKIMCFYLYHDGAIVTCHSLAFQPAELTLLSLGSAGKLTSNDHNRRWSMGHPH